MALVSLPGSSSDVVLVDDPCMTGLRAVLVARECVSGLDQEWAERGVYVLLGPGSQPGKYYGYVGEAQALKERVPQHRDKPEWTKALLVRRTTEHGFSSAHTGWLEGRLYQVLKEARDCELANKTTPGDDSVHPGEAEHLETLTAVVCAVMRGVGFNPDPRPADEAAPPGAAVSHALHWPQRSSGVRATALLLADGKTLRVRAGSGAVAGEPTKALLSRKQDAAHRAELVAQGALAPTEDGRLALTRDVDFPSMSAAASVLANGSESGPRSWRAVEDSPGGVDRPA